MMTWRGQAAATRRMHVWLLPNGWIVDRDGYVWPWMPYMPGAKEDPDGGFESEEGRYRVSLLYFDQPETVEYTTRPRPTRRDLDPIQKSTDGDLILVGSSAYSGNGGDVRLFKKDAGSGWYADVVPEGQSRGILLTKPLGTLKSGPIEPLDIDFDASSYPGKFGDPYTRAFNIV